MFCPGIFRRWKLEGSTERGKPVGYGGVAQLGEHLPCKQGVDSSILFISIKAYIERYVSERKERVWVEGKRPMTLTQNGLIAQVVRAHA